MDYVPAFCFQQNKNSETINYLIIQYFSTLLLTSTSISSKTLRKIEKLCNALCFTYFPHVFYHEYKIKIFTKSILLKYSKLLMNIIIIKNEYN